MSTLTFPVLGCTRGLELVLPGHHGVAARRVALASLGHVAERKFVAVDGDGLDHAGGRVDVCLDAGAGVARVAAGAEVTGGLDAGLADRGAVLRVPLASASCGLRTTVYQRGFSLISLMARG
ncbi:hypothetical protein SF12_13485 [Streptomyces sp. MBRL 601]|nr:hypothetical protein SF12_13485 [Streptomyces sp. MBRL 601]